MRGNIADRRSSRGEQAPLQAEGPVGPTTGWRAPGDRGGRLNAFLWPLLFLLLVAGDQLSKALAPKSWVYLDPGTGRLWPSFVNRAFEGSVDGAILDGLAVCLLVALAAVAVQHSRRLLTRAGATILLAGMSSNLLDRLGMDHITQGVPGRFVVNWFDVGLWRVYVGNVADCCYVVGCALLIVSASIFALRSARLAPVVALVTETEPGLAGRGLRELGETREDRNPAERLRSA